MGDAAASGRALSDLYLLLGRAFLPPLEASFAQAFVRDLPEDLGQIAGELPFDCAAGVAAFRGSVEGLEQGELLQAYSALFLQPPQRASLDASVYLDGAAMGPTTAAVEKRYASHGLRPSEALRELPDHLSRLLEFSGFLLGRAAEAKGARSATARTREAREFIGAFVRPWVPALAVEVRAACTGLALPRPYQHLAEIAAVAAWEGEGWRPEHRRAARAPRQALCARCARPYAEDAALRAVRRIMKRKGLRLDHLDRCGDCRGISDQVTAAPEPADSRGL
jgi:putative dimethyl sulfoxide reductase chaperone